jgi:hypothetical protein
MASLIIVLGCEQQAAVCRKRAMSVKVATRRGFEPRVLLTCSAINNDGEGAGTAGKGHGFGT